MSSIILGVGAVSTQFTEKLVREIVHGPRGHGLVAIGVYDKSNAGPKVRRKIRRMTKRLRVADISVPPPIGAAPEAEQVFELKKGAWSLNANEYLLIIDASYIELCQGIFSDLRWESPNAKMTAICFTDESVADQRAYPTLQRLTEPDPTHDNARVLEAIFMVSVKSPLAIAVGGQNKQSALVAKSMAGFWAAPLYRNYNPPFDSLVSSMRNQTQTFIGMAMGAKGVIMQRTNFFRKLLYPIARFTTWFISPDEAIACVLDTARYALANYPVPTSTIRPFDAQAIHGMPIGLNIVIPFRPGDRKFDLVADAVRSELGNGRYVPTDEPGVVNFEPGYTINTYVPIKGRGINLTPNKALELEKGKRGTFYCQVCILYSTDQQGIITVKA